MKVILSAIARSIIKDMVSYVRNPNIQIEPLYQFKGDKHKYVEITIYDAWNFDNRAVIDYEDALMHDILCMNPSLYTRIMLSLEEFYKCKSAFSLEEVKELIKEEK